MITDWLTDAAFVDRHVNNLYLLVVTCISLAVLWVAAWRRDVMAVRVYLYAALEWIILKTKTIFIIFRTVHMSSKLDGRRR